MKRHHEPRSEINTPYSLLGYIIILDHHVMPLCGAVGDQKHANPSSAWPHQKSFRMQSGSSVSAAGKTLRPLAGGKARAFQR